MRAAAFLAKDPDYLERGYAVIPELLDPCEILFIYEYFETLRAASGMGVDSQVPGSRSAYGTTGGDTLLRLATSPLSTVAGLDLLPTYSFVRRYTTGQQLVAHRDRAECEHSATIHISASDRAPWPIKLAALDGKVGEILLRPGDALLYRGDQLIHWRDPLNAEWYLQAFLHYVDRTGRHADRLFDGRPTLGMNPVKNYD